MRTFTTILPGRTSARTLAGTAALAGSALLAVAGFGGSRGGDEVDAMRAEVAAMQTEVAALRAAAHDHAATLERRQALLSAVLSAEGAKDAAPYAGAIAGQAELAARAQRIIDTRIALTQAHLNTLGVRRGRTVAGGMGGPFEPVTGVAATGTDPATATAAAATPAGDDQFRALFQTWKKLDTLEQTVIAIPSAQPVANMAFTSNFGIRSDPFRGTAAMHAGVDIPGPVGTPIYATADGIVRRAERAGGYGNLVEVNHGKGIETRFGHLSRILVQPNTRVRRGQLIGLMGSTGRSTGSHLHYEVRIDGRAVNPAPYLQTATTMASIGDRAASAAMGGPIASR